MGTLIALLFFGNISLAKETPTYFEVYERIFLRNCRACHKAPEPSAGLDVTTYDTLMQKKVIVPFKPDESLLFKKVYQGEMPKGEDPLPDEDIEYLREWILAGAPDALPSINPVVKKLTPSVVPLTGNIQIKIEGENLDKVKLIKFEGLVCKDLKLINVTSITCVVPPSEKEGTLDLVIETEGQNFLFEKMLEFRVPLSPSYHSLFVNIFKPRCVVCHSGENSPKGLDLSNYESMMAHRRAVIPFDLKRSRVYKKTFEGEMPKNSNRLSNLEVDTIGKWILQGAIKD
jgi:mono/diheme cytochrome c family protein